MASAGDGEVTQKATAPAGCSEAALQSASSGDAARAAALKASVNVPSRSRRGKAAPELRTFSHLPQYLRDNEYIINHYRADYSVRQGLLSLFGVHNETGNVWTHFAGFLLFLGLTFYVVWGTPAALSVPLAVGREQLETLQLGMHDSLQVLRSNLHSLSDNLHGQLYTLQSHAQQTLVTLHGSLHSKVHALQESLQNSVHALQGGVTSLQGNIHSTASSLGLSISDNLHGNLHAMQDALHSIRGLLNGHLGAYPGWQSGHAKRWPVYVYMAGAMTCLLMSSLCHLLGCCSKHMAQVMWRLDYTGIAVLIVTSFYPPVYYGFLCHPTWRAFYLTVTTAMGAAVVVVSLAPYFQTPKFRTTRATLFAALGVFGVVPWLHALLINTSDTLRAAMWYDILMGACYLGGAAIYAMRVPERWRPGAFDMVLHSHQIFHIAVVAGAVVHFCAVMMLLRWRDTADTCGTSPAAPAAALLPPHLRQLALELGALEQAWESFKGQLHRHVGL